MNGMDPVCLAYGPLIAIVVGLLKRIPWLGGMLARNAKVVAALAASVTALISAGAIPANAAQWAAFGSCVAIAFSGAVATHEAALDPMGRALSLQDPKKG